MLTYPDPGWNQTRTPFPDQFTIPDLIRAAVARDPLAPAVGDACGRQLTYGELDARSDQLAQLLAELGIGAGQHVALLSQRDVWAVVAMVAVLKAGAGYVPIDPAWPRVRAELLLDRLGVVCVVAGTRHQRTAQLLAADVPSVRAVVCPGRSDRYSAEAAFDQEPLADLFDYVVQDEDRLRAAGFNARGAAEHDLHDLEAYRKHIAGLVLDSTPEHPSILEIGCGSGEFVAEMSGSADRYVAVDVSPASVRKVLDEHGDRHPRLEGVVGPAHRVRDLVSGEFDVVLVSSTIQFFPDVEYLYTVLEAAVRLLRPGGRIVLGDLIDPAREDHAGLALSRTAFRQLIDVLPALRRVTIHERADKGLNGALGQRFDAELVVGSEPSAARVQTFWSGEDIGARPVLPPAASVQPDSVAYVIFTSGSTGVPKGVTVPHRPVVNLISWLRRAYQVGAQDRLLAVAAFCFDLSVFDVLGVLAVGGYLRVAGEEELTEPDVLIDLLVEERITIWDSAPAMLGMLTPFLEHRDDLAGAALRLVLLSGDWIPLTQPAEIRAAFPAAQVVALGGATECTVWSNHFPVGEIDPDWPSVPYGVPIDNARYYVLDGDLSPCPVGVPGDLYIGGECVAAGYAGDPELTKAKFLPDPWSPTPGTLMYRTGDRARWWDNGLMEFLGRLDDQVKIRGYRIELGEVRSTLTQADGVRAAVVLAVPGAGGWRLAAFYLGDGVSESDLREFAARRLPAHMVPEIFVRLTSFPVNAVGKVDRVALAELASVDGRVQ